MEQIRILLLSADRTNPKVVQNTGKMKKKTYFYLFSVIFKFVLRNKIKVRAQSLNLFLQRKIKFQYDASEKTKKNWTMDETENQGKLT